jgi:putative ABC transport system substrate-binding protein
LKYRSAVVLLLTALILTGLACSGQSWAQASIPRVGILSFFGGTDDELKEWLKPFSRTLAGQGWIEGKNVSFEYRSVQGGPSRLAETANELVRLKVDVIFADSAPSVRAARAATRTIPIVAIDFTTDPVAEGYVESYGRPGGNVTGVFLDAPEFAGKWFQLLKAMIPGLSRVVVLWDPSPGAAHLHAVQRFAGSFRVRLQVIEVHNPDDIDKAFSALRGHPQAVIILPSPMIYLQSEQLAKLAMKHRLPATSMAYAFAEAGGTITYGPEVISVYERCAGLVAKILGGAKPAELPVERPTKVQLIVNLKTAKALGLTVPESVLYRADEIIR